MRQTRKRRRQTMTVQIDIDMPKSCNQCPLAIWISNERYIRCALTKEIVDFEIINDKKHPRCSLKLNEVK